MEHKKEDKKKDKENKDDFQKKIKVSFSVDPVVHQKAKEILDEKMIKFSSYVERKLKEMIDEYEKKGK